MAGVKGRSGRRPFSEEMLRHRTVLKAWEVTSQTLHDKESPKRQDIAGQMVVKDMTSKESVDMRADITQHDKDILAQYIGKDRISLTQ
jgi:hypothetical protein